MPTGWEASGAVREQDAALKTLYLCYFGLREPLVQTQVLPYLRELRQAGVEVHILTFEPELRSRWTAEQRREWRERLAGEGIRWYCLPYHKRPSLPATVYDIVQGGRFAAGLRRRAGIDLFHGRGHMAAAMGALAKRLAGGKLLFDIRGFMPEEYVDAGVWPRDGRNYRITKAVEARLLKAADGFVVLTERAREILFPGAGDRDERGRPVAVIPCCVDLERFRVAWNLDREQQRAELGVTGRRVLVYVGALGGWYLTAEMAQFMAAAHRRDPRTFSMVLTQSPPEQVLGPLREAGVSERDLLVQKVAPDDVPRYLRAADLALSFIKPCYSKLASSPTKMAEYLASGLPVVCNAGIGDVDALVERERVGVLLRELDEAHYLEALERAERLAEEPNVAARCRGVAERHFDLHSVGGERYRTLYRRIGEAS